MCLCWREREHVNVNNNDKYPRVCKPNSRGEEQTKIYHDDFSSNVGFLTFRYVCFPFFNNSAFVFSNCYFPIFNPNLFQQNVIFCFTLSIPNYLYYQRAPLLYNEFSHVLFMKVDVLFNEIKWWTLFSKQFSHENEIVKWNIMWNEISNENIISRYFGYEKKINNLNIKLKILDSQF